MRHYFQDSVTGQLVYIDDAESIYNPSMQQQQAPMQGGSDLQSYLNFAQKGYDIYNQFGASGGSGGESGGGFFGGSGTGPSGPGGYGGPLGYAGIVAAAIAAQHAMSNATSRRFEGQQTKDAFGGSFATEPWLAYGFDKLGINSPTAGESFDAAWQNKDWKNVAERSPRALGYWGEPGTSVGYDVARDKLGEKTANIIFPNQYFLQQAGQLIGKLF